MKVFKPALVAWVIALALLFSFSNEALFAESNFGSFHTNKLYQQIERKQRLYSRPIPQPPISNTLRILMPDFVEKVEALYYSAGDYQLLSVKSLRYAKEFLDDDNMSTASKYIEKAERYNKQSNSLLQGSIDVLDGTISTAQWTVVYKAATMALKFTVGGFLGGPASSVVDFATLYTDYLLDKAIASPEKAEKNLLAKAVAKVLLNRVGGSEFIDEAVKHGWGASRVFPVLQNIIGSSEFKDAALKEFMRLGGDVGSFVAKKVMEEALSKLTKAGIEVVFVRTEVTTQRFDSIYRTKSIGPYIIQTPLQTSYGASDSWDDTVTVAQDQTTEGVDNNPTFTSGGNYWGHIALMLTKSGALEDVYSTLGPTNLASSNISVPACRSSRDMTMNGTSSPPQITALETSTGAVTVGIPVSIDMYELGNNSYATWGYWLQNNIMQAGGANYSVDNRGYYLTGDPATNAQMTNLIAHNNSGTYTGTANGTYWTNAGGANMSGTFNANVNFASRSLNNINISISGGGHSASISGSTATSSGSSSTFVSNSDGQWKIDGATLGSSSTNDLRGVVCGPTGKAVVGGFSMGQTVATTGVVIGVFQGTR